MNLPKIFKIFKSNRLRYFGTEFCKTGSKQDLSVIKKYNEKSKKNIKLLISISLYNYNGKEFYSKYFNNLIFSLKNKKYEISGIPIIIRIYVDNNCTQNIIKKLINFDNVEVFVVKSKNKNHSGSLWRFLPINDNIPFLTADADDKGFEPYSNLKKKSIKKWLKSDKILFSFVDIQGPLKLWPLLAGRVGCKAKNINFNKKNIENFIERCDCFGCDEYFLKELYSNYKNSIFIFKPRNYIYITILVSLLLLIIIFYKIAKKISYICIAILTILIILIIIDNIK